MINNVKNWFEKEKLTAKQIFERLFKKMCNGQIHIGAKKKQKAVHCADSGSQNRKKSRFFYFDMLLPNTLFKKMCQA